MSGFVIRWALEHHLSDRARAVQHALVIMLAAKVTTWDELAQLLRSDPERSQEIRRGVNLPLEDLQNLDTHEQTLRGLRRSSGNRASIVTTIAECDTCQRWGYIAGSAPPKSCPWTSGCRGKVTKIGLPDYTLGTGS
ncbi:hypothetical protein [Brachybacterium kimchii]|uniref:Uncharacterized protein n=1 Tax=Brachybacterium kimchii TaxID=2942909 RepID=A0ABY4NB09_9MICO|nr:hypothetical protein [Brachybacterium kimchii]UQN30475.1 hypothetical protein M4486_03795 [Brachybacterium kimchii]